MSIESHSPALPATTTGSADSWSFESNSIGQDPDAVLAQATEPGDEPAPEETPPPVEVPAAPAEPAKPAVEAKPAQPGKAKQTITQRTAVLKAELAEALRQRAEARAELDDLTRRRDALRQETTRQPAPQPRQPAPPPAPAIGPAPDWDAFEREGKSWKEYEAASRAHILAEAEARHEVKLREQIRGIEERSRADQQRARDADVAQQYTAKMQAAEAKYPDFAAQVDANLAGITTSGFMKNVLVHHAAGAEVLYHWARHPHEAEIIATLRPTRPIVDAVALADDPITLLSHFAAHRAEFEALTQMPPARQLYELGRLQTRLEGAHTADPPAKPPTKSPAPPTRLIGGTAAAGGTAPESSGDDFADYVRAENARQAARAGRRR